MAENLADQEEIPFAIMLGGTRMNVNKGGEQCDFAHINRRVIASVGWKARDSARRCCYLELSGPRTGVTFDTPRFGVPGYNARHACCAWSYPSRGDGTRRVEV